MQLFVVPFAGFCVLRRDWVLRLVNPRVEIINIRIRGSTSPVYPTKACVQVHSLLDIFG